MKLKDLIARAKSAGRNLLFLNVTFLGMLIIPLRVLFRRTPFKNFSFLVAFGWFNLITHLLRALGANVEVNSTIKVK